MLIGSDCLLTIVNKIVLAYNNLFLSPKYFFFQVLPKSTWFVFSDGQNAINPNRVKKIYDSLSNSLMVDGL